MSSKTKMIAVSEKTWRHLAQKGTLEDTFDTVIQRLIKDSEKVATSGQTLVGTGQIAATAPPPPSTVAGDDNNSR